MYVTILYLFIFNLINPQFAKTRPGETFGKQGSFSPVYATKNDVDVTPSALVGLIQNCLCKVNKLGYVFSTEDSFEDVDMQLCLEFLHLFTYLDAHIPSGEFESKLSPWLVCIKRSGHQLGVLVYSSDHDGKPPNGQDIIIASTINKNKTKFAECTLFLGTFT